MKMKVVIFSLLALSVISVIANASDKKEEVIAEVNGTKITEWVLSYYAKQKGVSEATLQEERDVLLEEVINRELIYQDAIKKGLDDELAEEREFNAQNFIATTMLDKKVAVKDEELRLEYEKQKDKFDREEYRAKHILLKEKSEANEIIKKLDLGENFSQLAEQFSIGPTKTRGGELGWFKPSQMVKPFAEALQQIPEGEYSKKPVETQFGWHVILVDKIRKISPPSFLSVKEDIRTSLSDQRMIGYISDLRESASIKRHD